MWNNSGFGGKPTAPGGYISSPGTLQESPSSQKPKSQRRAQNLVPITIADFYKAMSTSENVKIGDTEAGLLTFIGVVRKVDVQSTVHIYEIDDMTGQCLIVKRWLDESNSGTNGELPPITLVENSYARVNGVARKVQGQTFLLGINLRPVTDLNELTKHLLEVVHTKFMLTQEEKKGGAANSSMNNYGGAMAHSTPFQGANMDSNIGIDSGLPKEQAMILKIINNSSEPGGCSKQFLQQSLKLPPPVLNKALVDLCDEGHIYTTTDDEHYRGTYQS